jgi:hypothetical protein
MQIIVVTPTGDKVVIEVSLSNTIHEVKHKVGEETGIPPHKLQLGFQGKILDEGASLAAIGVADGHTLEMTWAFTTSSTSVTTTSSTPSQSFLAPKADTKPSLHIIAWAVILPAALIGIYAAHTQRLKRRFRSTKVTPIHIGSEPLKLWDVEKKKSKSFVFKRGLSFKSNFSRASVATTPDYKNKPPVEEVDSSIRSRDLEEGFKSLPHLLGSNGSPRRNAVKSILTGPSSGCMQDTPGDETNRNLNTWQTAHGKHFHGFQMQKEGEWSADVKIAAPQEPLGVDAQCPLRQVAQQSSVSASTPEVTLQDLELRHAARQTCTPSTPQVTEAAAMAHPAATSVVRAPPPLPTNIRPPPVWE